MRISLLLVYSFLIVHLSAQKPVTVRLLTSGTNTSLRGMSIPAANIIWVSGSNGTIGRSVDAGKTWNWIPVPGYEKRDFRDIQAFDSSTAIAMAVDNPAVIVKTTDGGASWKKVFERSIEGMFLDAMDFKNAKEGICIGDPLKIDSSANKRFYIIRTFDGGDTWREIPLKDMPFAATGEAIFAASGSNISFLNDPVFEYAFVTGGSVTNLHLVSVQSRKNKTVSIPITSGKESAGTFSLATDKHKKFYCIGGDYKSPNDTSANYCYTTNAETKWKAAIAKPPNGYRSCVCIINSEGLAACGTTGVDYSKDNGKEWQKASLESFNVCMASEGRQVFLAGEKGKIGMLVY